MNILALDTATHTGYAYMKSGAAFSGVWKNSVRHVDSPGRFFRNFGDWLVDMRRWCQPEVVAFEMPHPHSGHSAAVAYGMIAHVLVWACRHDMRVMRVAPNTLKKFTTGNGRADKLAMIRAMRKRWNLPRLNDDDQADALAVLAWALKHTKPEA